MNKKTLTIILVTLIVASLLSLIFYRNYQPIPNGQDSIKIGSIIPLTGESANWGANLKNGMELAKDEINSNGGIQEKKIEVIYEDSKGDAATGTSAINKLITADRVDMIAGDTISSVILAIAPIVEQNKKPLIGFGESTAITDAGDYIFRNWNSAASDITVTSDYAINHSKKIVVLTQNDAYGQSAKKLILDKLNNKVTIVHQEEFAKGQTDFRTILSKFKDKDYDGIYLACFYQEAMNLLKQYKELNMKSVNIYGISSWEENILIDFVKANFPNRVFYGYPLPPDGNSQIVKNFIENYTKRYGKKPEILADNGYDSIYMFKKAIELANSTDGEKVKDALYQIKDFDGASGKMSFDKNGDVDKPFGIKTIGTDGSVWVK